MAEEIELPASAKKQLLVGDALSTFGGWLDMIAILTIAAYSFHVTPYQMAIVSVFNLLPGIVLSKLIGKFTEAHSPLLIAQASLILRASATILILFSGNLIVFCTVIACRSVFASFTLPAINKLAEHNVPNTDKNAYLSMLSLVNGLCKILAPIIGGLLSEIWSTSLPLICSCILTLLSLIFFNHRLSIHPQLSIPSASSLQTEGKNISGGELFFLCVAVYFLFVFMTNNLLPLTLKLMDYSPALLGILIGASGSGNILASIYISKRATRATRIQTGESIKPMLNSGICTAACFLLIGLLMGTGNDNAQILLVISFMAIGIFSAAFSISTNRFLFWAFANRIGSATAKLQAVQNASMLAAPLLGAFIIDHTSPGILFISAGAIATIAFVFIYAHSSIQLRHSDTKPI
ncbi:hypothetical protein ALO62_200054 [Pseudomonas amygdali pv. myricae]|uniref:MFS transporter n=1 Tax=Pseudomonas amygdali TaxID=47877 RepID=UPI0006E6C648|nr:MFS transporter [Pseudomonas amygdali]KPY02090.1 hypothetical protein ALO62_200054 [Pseudomonas amygdali pv. myricae]KWS46943.1 hypothetical protein AL057_00165 [Pseudomonas amygdali pv. myricae]